MAGFRRAAVVLAALIASATAAGVVFGAHLVVRGRTAHAAAVPAARATPPAATFADELAGAANARSATSGGGTISHVSCLEGSPGSYACSFVRTVARGSTCAVAILRWTPDRSSTFTVQAAGRVALAPAECGPVRKVLHVLGTSG